MASSCVIGVDVGGTNTDAAVVSAGQVLAAHKSVTTTDVTTGLLRAIAAALQDCRTKGLEELSVRQVNVGTTHFVNAVVQRSPELVPVAVLRLASKPCTESTPPFSDFPVSLKNKVCGGWALVSGGFQFDGTELGAVSDREIIDAVAGFVNQGIRNFVVSGVFSPINPKQEQLVGKILAKQFPCCTFTLSHELGQIGLLERENASILNESLKPIARKALSGLQNSLQDVLRLSCPVFLAQNDGTICSLTQGLQYPIVTFASGPTNSMRGAGFISGLQDAIVVDIGGTSTDVGFLVDGFPREAAHQVVIGDVPTNFRMPNTHSIALGGGSIVNLAENKIGPQSVGYRLEKEGISFGGKVLTTTDVAVAAGMLPEIPCEKMAGNLKRNEREICLAKIHEMVETAIDQMKTSADEVDVILVGGGSVLISPEKPFKGCKPTIIVQHFAVANAIGAALCQVSGHVNHVASIDPRDPDARTRLIQRVKQDTVAAAVKNGAKFETVQIMDLVELPLTYLPGNATQIKCRAVGELASPNVDRTPPIRLAALPDYQTISEDFPTEQFFSPTKSDEESWLEAPSQNTDDVWELTEGDVECMAVGAGILGCGGGGNPHVGKIRLLNLIRQGKRPRVVSLDWLLRQEGGEKTPVYPTGIMGAPLILVEKPPSGKECQNAIQILNDKNWKQSDDIKHGSVEKFESGAGWVEHCDLEVGASVLSRSVSAAAVLAFEIGGYNSMEPLAVSALTGIPCLDADCMGRAFPELQMFTLPIYGMDLCPMVQASDLGRFSVALAASGPKALEDCFRKICIENGCSAGISFGGFPVGTIKDICIRGSMNLIWKVGKAVLEARKKKICPIQAILGCCVGKVLSVGKIIDVVRRTEAGFNKGHVIIESSENLQIDFQNENLVAWVADKAVATVPDLICILETETGFPITTEELKYGLRVTVVVLKPPELLMTETALKFIGPEAFGYENLTFKPDW